DQALYRITLDARGQEKSRDKLRGAASMIRFGQPANVPAFTPPPGAAARAGGGGRGAAGGGGRGFGGRGPVYMPGEWNTVQVIIDADIIRGALNGRGGLGAGVTEDESAGFGSIALYAGGTGEVRFKDLGWKDLGVKDAPPEKTSSNFRMQRLDEYYYSWGVA